MKRNLKINTMKASTGLVQLTMIIIKYTNRYVSDDKKMSCWSKQYGMRLLLIRIAMIVLYSKLKEYLCIGFMLTRIFFLGLWFLPGG